ncbi:hypothetical protein H4R21_006799, partial [Coemansia helicoidea]
QGRRVQGLSGRTPRGQRHRVRRVCHGGDGAGRRGGTQRRQRQQQRHGAWKRRRGRAAQGAGLQAQDARGSQPPAARHAAAVPRGKGQGGEEASARAGHVGPAQRGGRCARCGVRGGGRAHAQPGADKGRAAAQAARQVRRAAAARGGQADRGAADVAAAAGARDQQLCRHVQLARQAEPRGAPRAVPASKGAADQDHRKVVVQGFQV